MEGASSVCRVCHRGLKNPDSIAVGMGPICAGKNNREAVSDQKSDLFDFYKDHVSPIPNFSGDIILTRLSNGEAQANIPQRIKYHSPTGFEWGYGGSGPADLALNILSLFVPQEKAYALHQMFKWQFIATMPREGGTIPNGRIKEWISAVSGKGVPN